MTGCLLLLLIRVRHPARPLVRAARHAGLTSVQRLFFEIGAHSSICTRSPTLAVLASSWAWYFLDRRTVFFMIGCVKRRSTLTTMVLSFVSETTVPCRIRLGILVSPYLPAAFSASTVLTRAISRRTFFTSEVFSSCWVARWKRRLNCSFFSLTSSSLSSSAVLALTSLGFIAASVL